MRTLDIAHVIFILMISSDNPDLTLHSGPAPSRSISCLITLSELASLMNIYIHSYDNPDNPPDNHNDRIWISYGQ